MVLFRSEEIAWARVDIEDPFFENDWASAEVNDLPEVDSRRQKRVRSDGITPNLGHNLPSARVVWNYDREFMYWAVSKRLYKELLGSDQLSPVVTPFPTPPSPTSPPVSPLVPLVKVRTSNVRRLVETIPPPQDQEFALLLQDCDVKGQG